MVTPVHATPPRDTLLSALRRLVAERPAGESPLPRVPRSTTDIGRQLALELQVSERARVLVTGQIGVGKSTELWEFAHAQATRDNFLAIHCDLEKEMSPERCGALGVMLAILRDAWNFPQLFKKPQPEPLTRKLSEWLVEWLGARKNADEYVFRFGGGDFPISIRDAGKLVSLALGKAAQHQALLERHPDEGAVPDKLVALCNDYLDFLAEMKHKPVVLIVDHVDKVRDARAAHEVLVDAVSHWSRLRAALVVTAPYEFTLGSRRSSVENFWGRPVVVYPEPIPATADDGAIAGFYGWMRSAVGLEELLSDDDLRTLAYFSGGIPRTFVLLLSSALRYALYAGHDRVGASDVRRAVGDAEAHYQDYADAALAQVDTIVNTQQGLGEARDVLRSPIALLVRPRDGGGTSFHAHPLAEHSLEAARLRRRLPATKAS